MQGPPRQPPPPPPPRASAGGHVEVEATAGEAVHRRARLLHQHLGGRRALDPSRLHRVLLPLLLVVKLLLDLAQLLGNALDLVLVLGDLRVRHGELGVHELHLLVALLQRLLIDRELLGYLRPGLAREDRLELDVELLLVLDEQLLVDHLLRLFDEALLQHVDLLHELVGGWVGALELAPAVDVHRVLQLLGEGAHLGALLQQLALQLVDLIAECLHVRDGRLDARELGRQLADGALEQPDLLDARVVLALALLEGGLLDADLLVE
mmetsp:Transcript_61106/g.167634  ORF Transcript_61106/g.167634 Transcript_61106/m.167634 type:complete len:266 (+) Transcript_61106:146-943(+)